MLDTTNLANYPDKEIGIYYCKLFNGTMQGQIVQYSFTETTAPYLEWDLMNKLKKIPSNLKYNGNLYKKWIITRYPQAADYVWESIGDKISSPTITIARRTKSLRQWANTIAYRLHLTNNGIDSKHHMNPIGYYIHTNPDLMKFINDKLSNINLISNKIIHSIVTEIIATRTSMEKIQALTLVRAVKMFGLE